MYVRLIVSIKAHCCLHHRLDSSELPSGICIREHRITAAIKSVDTQFPAKTRRRCSAPRVEKIGEEISENVGEVGRRCRRRGRTAEWKDALVPGALLLSIVTAWKARKKKLPIYKPLAENEV